MTTITGHLGRRKVPIGWAAGAGAGVVAGVVFLLLHAFLVWSVHGADPRSWATFAASLAMGERVLFAGTVSAGVIAAGMVVHFVLSIAYGVIGAVLLNGLRLTRAAGLGALFGLALYFVNFFVIGPLVFPWSEAMHGGIPLFTHAIFGEVVGTAYLWLRARRAPAMRSGR